MPAIYGLESAGTLGLGIHIVHGIVLGLLFGLLVTRPTVLGVLWTDALSRTGIIIRVIRAGLTFGLTVWAILPLLVLSLWVDAVGGSGAELISGAAAGSLLGYALFGVVLGAVFATIVDLHDRNPDTPL